MAPWKNPNQSLSAGSSTRTCTCLLSCMVQAAFMLHPTLAVGGILAHCAGTLHAS